MRRGRLIRDKCQLRVMDDPVHHGIIRNKRDDLHLSSALGTNQRIDLVDFSYHLRPDPAVNVEAGMTPARDLLHHLLGDEFLPKQKSEDLPAEKLSDQMIIKALDMMEPSLLILSSLTRQ